MDASHILIALARLIFLEFAFGIFLIMGLLVVFFCREDSVGVIIGKVITGTSAVIILLSTVMLVFYVTVALQGSMIWNW